MSDITPTQHEKDLAYWRGRVDGHLESMNTRLELLEVRIESFHKDAVVRMEHIHTCIEKRSKILYLLSGGLIVLYMLVQLGIPIVTKLFMKP